MVVCEPVVRSRLLSAYRSEEGGQFWILTETDRKLTTVSYAKDARPRFRAEAFFISVMWKPFAAQARPRKKFRKKFKSLHPKINSLKMAGNPPKMIPDFQQIANTRLPSGAVCAVVGNTSAKPNRGTFANLPDGYLHRWSQQLPREPRRRHRERSR